MMKEWLEYIRWASAALPPRGTSPTPTTARFITRWRTCPIIFHQLHSSFIIVFFISNTIYYYCLSLLFKSSVRARGANAQLLPVRPQVRSLNWFLNSQWFSPQFTKEFLKRSFNVFPQFTKEFFKRSFNIAGQSNESIPQTKELHPTHSSPICK